MRSIVCCLTMAVAMFSTSLLVGQAPNPGTKAEPKVEPKAKGQLPMNWKQLGLTEDQVQKVYKVQNKYGDDIDKLEAQIKDMKAKMSKERLEVLTPEQKKKLEEIMKGKAGTEK